MNKPQPVDLTPLDARVLRELEIQPQWVKLETMAWELGISMVDLRASMRRLALRPPIPLELRLIEHTVERKTNYDHVV